MRAKNVETLIFDWGVEDLSTFDETIAKYFFLKNYEILLKLGEFLLEFCDLGQVNRTFIKILQILSKFFKRYQIFGGIYKNFDDWVIDCCKLSKGQQPKTKFPSIKYFR